MSCQLLIKNVTCYTFDEKKPIVEAVSIKGNKIMKRGSFEEIKEDLSKETHLIDGQGMTLLPGFSDAHTHFSSMGLHLSYYLNLRDVKNKEEALALVKERANQSIAGSWITGIAWDESKWVGDRSFPRKEELDQVAPHNPVALFRVDGHICCVNSEALQIIGYQDGHRGVEIEDGEPTGRLVEDAGFEVRLHTEPGVEGIIPAIQEATQKAHSLGVTAVHDVWVNRDKLIAYQHLRRDQILKMRVGVFLDVEYLDHLVNLGLYSLGDEYLNLLGIKLFVDGSIGAKTAMMKNGYKNDPENKGYPMYEKEAFQEIVTKAHTNHIKMAIHTIGDQALDEALEALEEASKKNKGPNHRLEHVEFINQKHLQKMKDLGAMASMQPNFTGEWGHPEGMYEQRFGPEVIKGMNHLPLVLKEGVTLLLGSDGMPFHPLYGIHSAVNPPFKEQRLTPLEAIRCYTQSGAGKYPGMITPLGLADLILLDRDPVKEPENIKDMKVVLTIFDGEIVYEN